MKIKLHNESFGEGQPVVILHGLLGSSKNWKSFARILANHFKVIILDLRNHGKSDHVDSMTYKDMAGDISNFLKDHGLGDINLIGHSMGGKTAMVFALTNPEVVKRLVVLDIAPVSYRNDYHSLLQTLQELPLENLTSRKHADDILAVKIPDTSLRSFLLQNLVQVDDNYRWRINIEAIKGHMDEISGFPLSNSIVPFPGPALFIGGKDSSYMLPEHHPVIRTYFSNSNLEFIDNAGHWLHIDQPETVLEKIRLYFQKKD